MCNQSKIQKFPNASDWPVKGQILGIDEISLDIVTFKETTYQVLTLCLCALFTVFAFFHIVFETSQLVEKYHEFLFEDATFWLPFSVAFTLLCLSVYMIKRITDINLDYLIFNFTSRTIKLRKSIGPFKWIVKYLDFDEIRVITVMTTSQNIRVHGPIHITEHYQFIIAICNDERVLKLSEVVLIEKDEDVEELIEFSKYLAARMKVQFASVI